MSGILGLVSLNDAPAGDDLVERMAAAAPSRGPDGLRTWREGPVSFGHQMLRSTPESAHETQPAMSADGRAIITWNGVLYNRAGLIGDLARHPEATAHPGVGSAGLAAEPDCMLVLRAYSLWGVGCVARFDGDFAFAVWDRAERQLFGAVDPFCVRQLFYHHSARCFVLASEEAQVLAVPGISHELDADLVRAYLVAAFPGEGRTFFREVQQLPEAHAFTLTGGSLRTWRYWTPRPEEVAARRDGDVAERFRGLFRDAVASRLRATGPVGSILSGGLDSSSVTAMAASILSDTGGTAAGRERVHAFTAVFDGLACDERDHASTVCAHLGVPHDLVTVDNAGFHGAVARILRSQATPFLAPNPLMFEQLFSRSREQGVRVCVLGDWGDEVLCSETMLPNLFRRLRWFRLAREMPQLARIFGLSLSRGVRSLAFGTLPPRLRLLRGGLVRERLRLLGRMPGPEDAGPAWRMALGPGIPPGREVAWLRRPSLSVAVAAASNAWMDRLATRAGVEVRYPFLDRRLVEFLLGAPDRALLRDGVLKPVLRDAMSDLLPESILRRSSKAEFSSLVSLGLREDNGARLRGLFEGDLASAPYLRTDVARRWVDDYLEGRALPVPLLPLFSLEIWLREHRVADHRPSASGD